MDGNQVKLNIGCGGTKVAGYVNCDVDPLVKPDVVCPADRLPFDDESADEIMAIHVFEHFYPYDVPGVLVEWRRVLRAGGRLVLELPDLYKCCKNFITAPWHEPHGIFGIYGDPKYGTEFMLHKYGYTPESLSRILDEAGFRDIRSKRPEYHRGARDVRDMRLEAVK